MKIRFLFRKSEILSKSCTNTAVIRKFEILRKSCTIAAVIRKFEILSKSCTITAVIRNWEWESWVTRNWETKIFRKLEILGRKSDDAISRPKSKERVPFLLFFDLSVFTNSGRLSYRVRDCSCLTVLQETTLVTNWRAVDYFLDA